MNAVPSAIRSFQCDSLSVHVFRGQDELAAYTVAVVRDTLAEAIRRTGAAAAILATGNSQLRFLKLLVSAGGVDWSAVTLFHMDEYLGLKADHPACFRHCFKRMGLTRLLLGWEGSSDGPNRLTEYQGSARMVKQDRRSSHSLTERALDSFGDLRVGFQPFAATEA